jgi:hypothetical protein
MIEKEFAPYEEALALKELGFDEPCLKFYVAEKLILALDAENGDTNSKLNGYNPLYVSAPTYSQAFRWFREKYNFLHHISWVYKKTEDIQWFFDIKGINMTNNNILPHSETRFATYEEAELACLKKLIQLAR